MTESADVWHVHDCFSDCFNMQVSVLTEHVNQLRAMTKHQLNFKCLVPWVMFCQFVQLFINYIIIFNFQWFIQPLINTATFKSWWCYRVLYRSMRMVISWNMLSRYTQLMYHASNLKLTLWSRIVSRLSHMRLSVHLTNWIRSWTWLFI